MSTVVDLELLGSQGFVIRGPTSYDRAGHSVSSAGDINGDGFDDIIIGAIYADYADGSAYVIFGDPGGFADIDLANLHAADGFAIRGAELDYAGAQVSGAGDINGDGFDDLLVSTSNGYYGAGPPKAYVIFGDANPTGPIELAGLATAQGFVIQGSDSTYYGQLSVSSAGDVNGDGFDDIVVGNAYGAGAAYVVFGKEGGFATIDLASLDASDGFAISGGADGDRAGQSVSAAGDVNGDGFDDIIIGAGGAGAAGEFTGAAYVIYGNASGFDTIDLANLTANEGFLIQGDAAGDEAGSSVSGAGDVNGDGFADIIVGALGSDSGEADAGAAYVIFGRLGGIGTIDLSDLDQSEGFVIRGVASGDLAGFSVSGAGDVNGDGFDDVIVGALGADSEDADAGKAYVIFGKASGFGAIDLANLDPADGFAIEGAAEADSAGFSVSGAGDLNRDGFSDIVVGAPGQDGAATNAGAAYVVFGVAPAFAVTRIGSDIGQTIRGGAGDDLIAGRAGDDSLFSAAGNDRLFGEAGNDLLDGATGFDILSGGDGDDTVLGREGNDRLHGGGGIDRLRGGADDDVYVVTDATDYALEAAGEGIDTVFSEVSLWLRDHVENLTLRGTSGLLGKGNDLDNVIVGNSGSNRLLGDAGDDRLHGQDGDDRLEGGAGLDRMYGGDGDDIYIVTDSTDFAYEKSSEGTDRVYSSVDHALRQNVEYLILTGSGDLAGRGNDLANTIVGNGGSNRLLGREGNDRLHGRDGNDLLFGESDADVLVGGNGADWLEGGAGRDQLYGGAGADRYAFRDGDLGATISTADIVRDFDDAEGDRIRLDLVDASTIAGGDQNFTLIGSNGFTGSAGELRWQHISGNTYVQGDTDGDGLSDFWIRVDGLHTLASDDFIL